MCSIAAKKLAKPIRTFAIGMDTDAIDLKYARQTAEYLGSEHREIIDQSRTIVGFWMPNKAWPGCNVNDPSARVLANYGASGV